ncbi:MAG: hypothetical protein IJS59_05625 [Bacteroidaceae bacterium]|nr:hypothetical protein [Bacteroidaceae bacterium]
MCIIVMLALLPAGLAAQVTIGGSVYGGARQANVGGTATVALRGGTTREAMLEIRAVYGGNDVSGTVDGGATVASAGKYLFVGQVFGGGNGDYTYTPDADGTFTVADSDGNTVATLTSGKPHMATTALALDGGTFGYAYGGGNAATITASTTIAINNTSDILEADELPGASRLQAMGINTNYFDTGGKYHFARVFGGNNKETMAISPSWQLTAASIENLYSGGNAGNMTAPDGISLAVASSGMTVENVYGGCRMADVAPSGDPAPEYGATVSVAAGTVRNVYGGNDVSGNVYLGTHVEILTSIAGNVYGGGNGGYLYTDNAALANDPLWGDFYYDATAAASSVAALLDWRPHVGKTLVHLAGTDTQPTYIGGAVYCGGNSATLRTTDGSHTDATATLRIGSHVVADNVFLGSNGEDMVSAESLQAYKQGTADGTTEGEPLSTIDLTDDTQMAAYMQGVEVAIRPHVEFDDDYVPYSTHVGSFFCGGNVGSMSAPGTFTIDFLNSLIIYDKLVAGCNNANVTATDGVNAQHLGGLVTATTDARPKVQLNLQGLKLQPKRIERDATTAMPTSLVWNTTGDGDARRLVGGNIYGGCYASGHVAGDIVINIEESLVDKDNVFGDAGVSLERQRDDVMSDALNVFGGGYGRESEIWGSTTVNLRAGYAFKVFGGGDLGAIGREKQTDGTYIYNNVYSTTVNLMGATTATATNDVPEAEDVYGGGFKGLVAGNTTVNLGNGRLHDAFGGACNADILGHTETYVGRDGFPWVKNNVYGGNDLGGSILGQDNAAFQSRLSATAAPMVYNPTGAAVAEVVRAAAYVEYTEGRVGNIYGGSNGHYAYTQAAFPDYIDADGQALAPFTKPRLASAFVNFRPNADEHNSVGNIYGGSMGYSRDADNNRMQDRGYVLIDIPQTLPNFASTQVFGAGDFAGTGIAVARAEAEANADGVTAAAIIDLARGHIAAAYGGSYQEGTTRRTIVNVPVGSTAEVQDIFGGAYGLTSDVACDVYEATVNYASNEATVTGALYGGNNNCRRTLYGTVNVSSPVWSNKASGHTATVYGAGYGPQSWSRRTEVNLNAGASVNQVYGGGNAGMVLNVASAVAWQTHGNATLDTGLDGDYTDDYLESLYAMPNGLGTVTNTNVNINAGATVGGYAYGGGYGATATISGKTYIGLHGGIVAKDMYAGGTSGAVEDKYGVGAYDAATNPDGFTAETYAYVRGGSARNVYGGGWEGHVGHHEGDIDGDNSADREGDSHVVIGRVGGTTFADGVPAIARNAYGGGEGGSVFGTAHVTMNNGYVGYAYTAGGTYEAVVDDHEADDNLLDDAGNIFGGGYVANSFTDASDITMWGGTLRGSLYGGGEIGPIGRGTTRPGASTTHAVRTHDYKNGERCVIYKGGSTNITMYGGHVMREVFGGGRGFDNWGGDGTMYMSDEVKATLDLSLKGYVFGSTQVRIRGGEVGTVYNVGHGGYGNVFGGGNVGYVFSSEGEKHGDRSGETDLVDGLPRNGGGYYYHVWYDNEADRDKCELSMDCNVVIEPYCQVRPGQTITIDNTYTEGQYVPTEELNKLRNKEDDAARWAAIDWESGITIHNAVFAGGNVTIGSDQVYVNTGTVYGNVTAALRDIYNRDLITIGTEHTGGLYGDGNLTMVDGYRELHIDNYGTDYYSMEQEITKEQYNLMSDRERAYFVLNYKCLQACDGKNGTIHVGDRLTADQFKEAFDYDNYESDTYPEAYKLIINADGTPNTAYFEELGFCSIYAGRLLNTIQRCDMAAVWGSRIVLQGARDRVPEKADFTRYTMNRVGELSLNQRKSQAEGEASDNVKHGNYFGIYNVVNYLGNLTSDVFFTETPAESTNADFVSKRTTDSASDTNKEATTYNGTTTAYGETTYYQWKAARSKQANRNNATSVNRVSLASGVYLEIIREESEALGHTEWGYITGVVQLDLIDVKTGLGGGYVYAKNEHGTKTWHPELNKVNLSPYNTTARTYKRFTYSETTLAEIETSGNFVHNTKQIVDDCYPNANLYEGSEASPAHYWYIKGSIYVYDQYISAFTGAATAYAQRASIPLTISASTHGKLTLRDVQPNRYAYYDDNHQPLGTASVVVNGITYRAADPIDYWSYQTLSATDQAHFVSDVYTTIAECTITSGDVTTTYPKGTTLLPDEYTALRATAPLKDVTPDDDDATTLPAVYHVERDEDVAFDYVFRQANAISHNEGFVLTFDMNNPGVWDKYYTLTTLPTDANAQRSITKEAYEASAAQASYNEGPTYTPIASGVYGQKRYARGEVIASDVYESYATVKPQLTGRTDQAEAERAYVVTEETMLADQHLYPGAPVYRSNYDDDTWTTKLAAHVALASVCTSTLKVSESEYIYTGDLLSAADIADKGLTAEQQANNLADAYIITHDGLYGGTNFVAGQTYSALSAWCSLSKADRDNFLYNFDSMDLLIDAAYGGDYGFKPQYDGYAHYRTDGSGTTQTTINRGTAEPLTDADGNAVGTTVLQPNIYSATHPIDYEAEFRPSADQLSTLTGHIDDSGALTYTDETGNTVTIPQGYDNRIRRDDFEDIPNERAHWSPIIVTTPGTYYVVKQAFIRGDVPYTVGQVVDETIVNAMTDAERAARIDAIEFTTTHTQQKTVGGVAQVDKNGQPIYDNVFYYFCRESYTIGEKGEGRGFTNMGVTGTVKNYTVGDIVDANIVIDADTYHELPNLQAGFTIHGTAPQETSTFYVSREPDIYDLQKEKIITVIYMYEYQESDESGSNITPVSERHIINIHINFESGIPEIGPLSKPNIVLPGTTVGLKIPSVEPGAFEITGSGWEVFSNHADAEMHRNGRPYKNNETPMYWYQNGYEVAYYAQSYLGKTYSNPVAFSVANYHDIKRVMEATDHHYYIDHEDVKRAPKIYINDYSSDASGSTNGLDLMRQLFDLTCIDATTADTDDTTGLIASGDFAGHAPLNSRVRGAENLELILRSDQNHSGATWTPIGDDTQCFAGNFHGDGYTVTGLDHSLFGHLCGNVYNLGVTGSFATAGVADTGDGFVENCWVKTTATTPTTSSATARAVFGNPTDDTRRQLVNSYYPASNAALYADGDATVMPDRAFYNGTVAFNLNGYYLGKRFYDNTTATGATKEYTFLKANADATLTTATASYPEAYTYYDGDRLGYVEHRYAYPDFIYAGGPIPDEADERALHGGTAYAPIWPDDYLFFGQLLTYGYDALRTHQPLPAHCTKSGSRLPNTSASNRVMRAPAYYRSKQMDVAHFNPWANLAARSADATAEAYPGMTAIDFTGHNDAAYHEGTDAAGRFYPPLLDCDGLTGIANRDLTRNLLIYVAESSADATSADGKTRQVVSAYNTDPAFSDYLDTSDDDRRVGHSFVSVNSHVVERTAADASTYTTATDHYLVDREDFNAPIAYTMGSQKRMWHQRTPDNFVSRNGGWENISLPFTAELVSTQQKGELTHFYAESTKGHEYWLREYRDITALATDKERAEAVFRYPDADATANTYTATSTFLWDYYYSANVRADQNADTYQQYYSEARTFDSYPRMQAATPYLIGFPGATFYEFDLSGQWTPAHTAEPAPDHLERQVVTFASDTGAAIGVSDDEMAGVTHNGYAFRPNYMKQAINAGSDAYVLAADGASYDRVPATGDAATLLPFRPYFTANAAPVKGISFANEPTALPREEATQPKGELLITALTGRIEVRSALDHDTQVAITTVSGALVATFNIAPGQTVSTPVKAQGIYIVCADGHRIVKKTTVK